MVAVLGLTSALVYGASDFLGGIAARRLSSLVVSLLGTVVALAVVAAAVAVTSPTWSASTVLLGAVAGVSGALAMWAFYAALALGPMSILSPGVAMIYAVVPAVVGVALGERLSALGVVAVAAVVVAAVLLAVPAQRESARLTPRGVLLGAVAGLGFAGYIIAIDATPSSSGLVPLLVDLVVSVLIYGGALLVTRCRHARARTPSLAGSNTGEPAGDLPRADPRAGRRRAVAQSLASGLLVATGNILLVVGLHLGDLAVMGVLNALYPLGTVLLAIVVLRERLRPLQAGGIVLALAASVALALG